MGLCSRQEVFLLGICESARPPSESKVVSNEFANYLNKRLDRQGIVDISRQMKSLIDKVSAEAEVAPIDDLSNIVQEFYTLLRKRLETHQLFQSKQICYCGSPSSIYLMHNFCMFPSDLTEEEHGTIMAYCEKYVMICMYKALFCPPNTDDEDKDLELQNRIRSLNWISTIELKCEVDESSQEVRDILHDCINGEESEFLSQAPFSNFRLPIL